MQTVRVYTRVSTEEQAQEGFSIAAQRQALQKWAESLGYVIAEWYVEEGRSAKDLDRPALSRLRADLRPGEIVIVYKLDRLTRSVLDLYSLLEEWETRQVGFRSMTEVYDTTTAMGRLFLTLVAALAQWERENLAERVKFGMTEMVKQGKWYGGPLPFGYVYDQVAGKLVPHPEQAAMVKQIYRWYAEGRGTRAIAIEMNRSGRRTNQGAQWSPYTIYHILRSQVYLGHTVWNKKGKGEPVVVPDTHEPIVTPEMVTAVADAMARHADHHPREIASTYPLTGLLKCGLCGANVSGTTQRRYDKARRPRWESRSYWCQERKVRKGCTMPSFAERAVEAALFEQITQLADQVTLEQLAREEIVADPHADERQRLDVELQSIRRRIRRWWDDYDAGDVPARVANERTAELETRAAEVQSRLAQISPPRDKMDTAAAAQLLADLPAHWRVATVEEKKMLLAELFEQIVIYPDGRVIPKLKPLRI